MLLLSLSLAFKCKFTDASWPTVDPSEANQSHFCLARATSLAQHNFLVAAAAADFAALVAVKRRISS